MFDTSRILQALADSSLPHDCRITVVMGATAPWLQEVTTLAATLPWPVDVQVNVSDMAQRMADADLAIGAAGSTSWERCCLGLPTIMLVLADNQRYVADQVAVAGAALVAEGRARLEVSLLAALEKLLAEPVANVVACAAALVDGLGAQRVAAELKDADD